MKIVIAIVVPILVGIVVGSNLSSVMTIVILNQPTVALPIGVWLLMAISCGLLSSSLIQIGIWIDRRLLKRQIHQLQTRLQRSDEDIFTYTSSSSEPSQSSTEKPPSTVAQEQGTSTPKKSIFSSYRSKFTAAFPQQDRFTDKSSPQPIVDEDDDWDVQPRSNRQIDWDDETPVRQQNSQSSSNNSASQSDKIYSDRPVSTRSEVYDADFRLIQPPYKEPTETEFDEDLESADFEETEVDRDEDFDSPSDSVKQTSAQPSRSSTDLDDEDWGFDFDRRDPPIGRN